MDYIVRSSENEISVFYDREGNIYYKIYEEDGFQEERLLIEDVFAHYSICIAEDRSHYLFCQKRNGDIVLCIKKGVEVQTKTILQNQSETVHKVQFTALISEKELTLIYNTESQLLMQKVDKTGKWKSAETIDTYKNLPHSAYISQRIACQHLILFYKTAEQQLAYREVNNEQYGQQNIVYADSRHITDTSFLINNDGIHMIFIIKGTFSYQLLYRKKDSSKLSEAKILWESPQITNCLIFSVKNKLYVSFAIYNQLYTFESENNGESFSQILKYKENFATHIKKAQLISETLHTQITANEVYISNHDPCNILLLPDLCQTFYHKKEAPIQKMRAPEKKETAKPIESSALPKRTIDLETFNRLQSQYNALSSQMNEKDRQIEYYEDLLKAKNAEIQDLQESKSLYEQLSL